MKGSVMGRMIHWWVMVLICVGCKGESTTSGPTVGSETHWMSACNDGRACGDGLVCQCGVCAPVCDADGACAEGQCAVMGDDAHMALCGAEQPEVAMCTPVCVAQADCEAIGPGLTCEAGRCLPTSPAPEVREARQSARISSALDILLVIDNSGSMCEEQNDMARAVPQLVDTLLDRGHDLRVATVTTDVRGLGRLRGGEFVTESVSSDEFLNCNLDEEIRLLPEDVGCPEVLPAIVTADAEADRARITREIQCQLLRGTQGDGFEKGLEAMRLALSCQGHNREAFGACCVQRPIPGAEGTEWVYDIDACDDDDRPSPAFLRPEATLSVVFVSDEDDCSVPDDNPPESAQIICQRGAEDADDDGVPDGYADAPGCAADPAACFRRECGARPGADCYAEQCVIDYTMNTHCAWFRDRLVPVSAYRQFLSGLKRRPAEQVVINTLVGPRAFTESGVEVSFVPPGQGVEQVCEVPEISDACCLDGLCAGEVQLVCDNERGLAYSGRRYLDLAGQFAVAADPCGADDPGACLDICNDTFADMVGVISDGVRVRQRRMCFETPPACALPDGTMCTRPEELQDPAHYAIEIEVSCNPAVPGCEGGRVRLQPEQWMLNPEDAACTGGASVTLSENAPLEGEYMLRYSGIFR